MNQMEQSVLLKGSPKTPFVWSFPIRQEILNVSQIAVAFHGICLPTFIQTWVQQYSRGAFLYSLHCSFSSPIGFWSVWCRRAMIPGKIFTGVAEFWGIVSVNDFRLPIGLQEFLQASLSFLWSCLFYKAWIHWVAKSCSTTAYQWLFRDSQHSLRTLWSAVIK